LEQPHLSKIIVGDIESRDTDRVGGIIYPDPDYLLELEENAIMLELYDRICDIVADPMLTLNKINPNIIRLANGG
jgi:hypothetical protein